MPLKSFLTAKVAAENMHEKKPKFRPQEALVEAERCLYCFDAPCIAACPTGIDIPSFIKKIAEKNLTSSARVILESNPLGASCARVCPVEVLCEGACVMLDRDEKPLQIGRLQRYATDHVFENNIQVLRAPAKKNGKSVAVIGGGPAGLGCAAELAQLGYSVTVFEKDEEAGGLNTYGIAYYKMRPDVSIEEVEMIKKIGVKIKTGVEVGKKIKVAELEKKFDAIFIGVGLSSNALRLNIPGENLPEVVEALDFIRELHVEPLHKVKLARRVAVIGCGNTAIDAVAQAKRLGAEEAIILYRRREQDMPAYPHEYASAKGDGAEFWFNVLPVEVLEKDGHVTGLKLVRTKVNDQGKAEIIPGSEFVEPFGMVIKALTQAPRTDVLKRLFPKLKINKDGTVARNEVTGQTNLKHVFTAGDCANGGREVVNAVGEGRKAARGIHKWLTGEAAVGPIQKTRYGVKKPYGSGLDHPVRAPELEEEYYAKQK
ncbi:MAG: NAD(P)-dependent oxidoreductase [Kiritimatiellae bacterium]|nr:NAD(P)-dependent oxidoreductase [Kiritimatiellia bacterium]